MKPWKPDGKERVIRYLLGRIAQNACDGDTGSVYVCMTRESGTCH